MEVTVRFRAPLIEKHLKRIGDLMEGINDVLTQIGNNAEVIAEAVQAVATEMEQMANQPANLDPAKVQEAHDRLVEQGAALRQLRDQIVEIVPDNPPAPTP